MMKKLLVSLGVVGALTFTMAPAAQAVPHFGQRHTGGSGWIVWVKGDYAFSRVRCTWWAGQNWHLNYLLSPHQYKWTTSDAGNWGDTRPQNLDCTYHRA